MARDLKQTTSAAKIPIQTTGTGSSPIEYVSNLHGQGKGEQLELLENAANLGTSRNVHVTDLLRPSHSMSNQPSLDLQPENAIDLVSNHFTAEYSTPDHENITDLICSEELVPGMWGSPEDQWLAAAEDELMIQNLHVQKWQDELILFDHHQTCCDQEEVEEAVCKLTGLCECLHEPKEAQQLQVSLNSRVAEEVNGSCCLGTSLSDIDVIAESFSFWPKETAFYSCTSSPCVWPGSPSAIRQPHESFFSYGEKEIQTPSEEENIDASIPTATLEYTMKPDATAAFDVAAVGEHEVVGVEACDYSGESWIESHAFISMMSQRDDVVVDDAGPWKVRHENCTFCCRRASAQQETIELQRLQSVFAADSLKFPLDQDENVFGDSAVAALSLQDYARDLQLLLHNSKRDRTNSIEMLSKPTSALRKKKQKDADIPDGRLRGTSICTDPNLHYGLAAVQNLLKDFHESAGFTLKAKDENNQRPEVADLLDAELEALCVGDNLSQEIRGAVFEALKRGCGNQQHAAAEDSEVVEHILDLKMRLVSLLEESRCHERSTLSQLKETVSRYSFLFPTSAMRSLAKRLTQSVQFSELESVVCQYFRESKIFTRPSPSSASSSSGRLGKEYSSDEVSVPSSASYPIVRGHPAAECLGEGTSVTQFGAERSERTRITSRRELSGARGNLPRVAAEFMRRWLFDNFDNPNPSRETKMFIATKFNITEKQVTNHFVNLRARKYRPLLRSLKEDSGSENVFDDDDDDDNKRQDPEEEKGIDG